MVSQTILLISLKVAAVEISFPKFILTGISMCLSNPSDAKTAKISTSNAYLFTKILGRNKSTASLLNIFKPTCESA